MISTASHCAHGNQMHDCSVCRTSEEIRELRAKLKAVEGIAHKFAEAARDACIAGLVQSAKLRQAEDRIAELEAERDRLRQERLDYSSVTTTEGLNCSEWIWRTGAAERKAKDAARTATEAALKYSYNELSEVREASDRGAFISRAIKALLEEGEK